MNEITARIVKVEPPTDVRYTVELQLSQSELDDFITWLGHASLTNVPRYTYKLVRSVYSALYRARHG